MRSATILLSLATILSLNLLLLLGAAVEDPDSIRRVLNGLVVVLDLSLVSSSGLLGVFFMRRRCRILGALFLLNILIFGVAVILRISGVRFPPVLLFAADLYWLNLYLIGLTRHFDGLSSPSA